MSNTENLNENLTRQDADEAALLSDEMDHEVSNTTPTTVAQASLQSMALGEKEKYDKELATCSQLLDQVRGYFGFDRVIRYKAKDPIFHNGLERALQRSSHAVLKHAETYGSAAVMEKAFFFLSFLFCCFSPLTEESHIHQFNVQQNHTPLPLRETQTRGGNLQA